MSTALLRWLPMTVRPEDELLHDLSRPGASEALVNEAWPRAYRVALSVLGDPDAAQDVAQETCLKLVSGARGFDRRRPLRPWYLQVARNSALDLRRGRVRRSSHEARASRGERVEGALDVDMLAVREQLAALDVELRAVLALHYLEDLTYRETAQVLGCPAGTVATRIRRGLKTLRGALEGSTAAGMVALLPRALDPGVPASPSRCALASQTAPRAQRHLSPRRAPGPGPPGWEARARVDPTRYRRVGSTRYRGTWARPRRRA